MEPINKSENDEEKNTTIALFLEFNLKYKNFTLFYT